MTTQYVLGFCVDKVTSEVLLIRKARPEWQCGQANGIGGHVEPGELPLEAMRREFAEETGVMVDGWRQFCRLAASDGSWVVHCFTAVADLVDARGKDDEPLLSVPPDALPINVIDNLHWLVPMAFARSRVFARVAEVA